MLSRVGPVAAAVWLLGLPSVYVLYRFRQLSCIRQLRPRRLTLLFFAFGFYGAYLYVVASRVLTATAAADPSRSTLPPHQQAQLAEEKGGSNSFHQRREPGSGTNDNISNSNNNNDSTRSLGSLVCGPLRYVATVLTHTLSDVYAGVRSVDLGAVTSERLLMGATEYVYRPARHVAARAWHTAADTATDPQWWGTACLSLRRLPGDIFGFHGYARVRSAWWPAKDAGVCAALAVAQAMVATYFYGSFLLHTNALWLCGASVVHRRRRQRAMTTAAAAALSGMSSRALAAHHASAAVGRNASQPTADDGLRHAQERIAREGNNSQWFNEMATMHASSLAGRLASSGRGQGYGAAAAAADSFGSSDDANNKSIRDDRRMSAAFARSPRPPTATATAAHNGNRNNNYSSSGSSSIHNALFSPAEVHEHGSATRPTSSFTLPPAAPPLRPGEDEVVRRGPAATTTTTTSDDVLPVWVVTVLAAFPFSLVCAVQLTTIQLTRLSYISYTGEAKSHRAGDGAATGLGILCPPFVSTVAAIGLLAVASVRVAFWQYKRRHPLYRLSVEAAPTNIATTTPSVAANEEGGVVGGSSVAETLMRATAATSFGRNVTALAPGALVSAESFPSTQVRAAGRNSSMAGPSFQATPSDMTGHHHHHHQHQPPQQRRSVGFAGADSGGSSSSGLALRCDECQRGGGGGEMGARNSPDSGAVHGAPLADGALGWGGKEHYHTRGALPHPAFRYAALTSLSHILIMLSPGSPALWCLALFTTAGSAAKMMWDYTWQPVQWLATEYSELCGRSACTVFFSRSFVPFDLDGDEDAIAAAAEECWEDEAAAAAAADTMCPDVVVDLKRVLTDVPLREVVKAISVASGPGSHGAASVTPAGTMPVEEGGGATPLFHPLRLPTHLWSSVASKVRQRWRGRPRAAAEEVTHSPNGNVSELASMGSGGARGGVRVLSAAAAVSELPAMAVIPSDTSTAGLTSTFLGPPHRKRNAVPMAATTRTVVAATTRDTPEPLSPMPFSSPALLPSPHTKRRASGAVGTGTSLAPADLRGSILMSAPQAVRGSTSGPPEDPQRRHDPMTNSFSPGNAPLELNADINTGGSTAAAAAAAAFPGGKPGRCNSGRHRGSGTAATMEEKVPTIEDLGAVLMVDTQGNRYIINGGGDDDDDSAMQQQQSGADDTGSGSNSNSNRHTSSTNPNLEGMETSGTSTGLGNSSFAPLNTSFSLQQNNSFLGRQLLDEEESFARFLDAIDSDGDDTATLQRLLQGHGKNLVFKRDHKGRTALHHATLGGFVEGVQLLLGLGANPNTMDDAGEAPLHMAVNHHTGIRRQSQLAAQHLTTTAKIITQVTGQHTTPLAAAMSSHRLLPPAAAASLRMPKKGLVVALVHGGADVNLPTGITGLTPLHLAIAKNEIGVMNTLLRLGANPVAFLEEGGPTAPAPSVADAAADDDDGGEEEEVPRRTPRNVLVPPSCTMSWAETHLSHAGIASSTEFRKSPVMLAAELNADVALTSMLTALTMAREAATQVTAVVADDVADLTHGKSDVSFFALLLPRCRDHQLSVLQVALALGHAATVHALLHYLNEESSHHNPGVAPQRALPQPSSPARKGDDGGSVGSRDGGPRARRRCGSSVSSQGSGGWRGTPTSTNPQECAFHKRTGTSALGRHSRARRGARGSQRTSKHAHRQRQQQRQRAMDAGVMPSSVVRSRRFTCSRELQCEHERKTVFHFAALGDSTEALAYLLEVGFHAPDFVPEHSDFATMDTAWHTRHGNANVHRLTTPSLSVALAGAVGSNPVSTGDRVDLGDEEEGTAAVQAPEGEWFDHVSNDSDTAGRGERVVSPAASHTTTTGSGESPPPFGACQTARQTCNNETSPASSASLTLTQRQQRMLIRRRQKQHLFIHSVVQLAAQRPTMTQQQQQRRWQHHTRAVPSTQNLSATDTSDLGSTKTTTMTGSGGGRKASLLRYGAVHVGGGGGGGNASAGARTPSTAREAAGRESLNFGAAVVKLRQRAPGVPIDLAHLEHLENAVDAACATGNLTNAEKKLTQRALLVVSQRLWQLDQVEKQYAGASVYTKTPAAPMPSPSASPDGPLQSCGGQLPDRHATGGTAGAPSAKLSCASHTRTRARSTADTIERVTAAAAVTKATTTTLTHAPSSRDVSINESHSFITAAAAAGETTLPQTADRRRAALTAADSTIIGGEEGEENGHQTPTSPLFVDLSNMDIVLSYIAVCLNQCDDRGMTPLHYAIVNQNANMVYVLCIYGARFLFASQETQRALTEPQLPFDNGDGNGDGPSVAGAAATSGPAGSPVVLAPPPVSPALTWSETNFNFSLSSQQSVMTPTTATATTAAPIAAVAAAATPTEGTATPPSAHPPHSLFPPPAGARALTRLVVPVPPSARSPSDVASSHPGASKGGHLPSPVIDPVAPTALEHATEAYMDHQEPAVQEALAVAAKTEDAGEFLAALPPVDPEACLMKHSITAITDSGASLTRSMFTSGTGWPALPPTRLASASSDVEAIVGSVNAGGGGGAGSSLSATTADAAMITATLVLRQLAQQDKDTEAAAPSLADTGAAASASPSLLQRLDSASSPLVPLVLPVGQLSSSASGALLGEPCAPASAAITPRAGPTLVDPMKQYVDGSSSRAPTPPADPGAEQQQQQQQRTYDREEQRALLLRDMIEPHDVFLLHVVRNPMKAEAIVWAATEGMAVHARVMAERAGVTTARGS